MFIRVGVIATFLFKQSFNTKLVEYLPQYFDVKTYKGR